MAAAEPYIARRPQLTLDTTVTLDCHAREVRLTPDDAEIDTAVFCSPSRRVVGKTDWTLELVVLQSFGNGTTTEGLYDQLAPMSKTQVNYLLETDKPVLDATISEKSEFTLTFAVADDPVKVVA